jgi:hypothetical protein
MPDPELLKFSVESYTLDQLTLKVQNTSGASLDKGMTIELRPVAYLVDRRIKEAAREAATKPELAGVKSLSGVVTGPQGWTIWAMRESTDNIVFIMLVNDKNEARADIPPTKLDAGAEFTIRIPLNRDASRATVDLLYSYETDTDPRQDGKLELKSAEAPAWTPDVTLTTDQRSPTMIDPKTDVKIFWHIKDGVSATLRGPLPGGNSEWTLSDSTTSNYKISDGSFQIKAVGAVTYVLQAEVKHPEAGKPNVIVVKMLSLDVYTKGKYAYVNARPHRVLPFGLVEIDWAAWGVKTVKLDAGGVTRTIPLTDMTLSGDYQGMGVMRINAGKPASDKDVLETTIDLDIEINNELKTEATTKFRVIPWRKMLKSNFNGQPIGLAIAAPKMALLTTDGLHIADVGNDDFTPINYDQKNNVPFEQPGATDKPKAWLALAALENDFVVLRQTNEDDLQVALYTADGRPGSIAPVDLPADLRPLMAPSAKVFDLVVWRGRAYVVVESPLPGDISRRAFSVGFDRQAKKADFRAEPLLESLTRYRLLTFDDTLYALHRNSGRMFCFSLTRDGKLDQCYKAAGAVDSGSSMIMQGVFVPVGRVFAVLSPSSVPSLASLEAFGLKNVLTYTTLGLLKNPNTIPQDLIYNPQNNRWARCGHGLDVQAGVVAFRGGDSPRLWLIEPNGDTYTLTVSSEHLFSHDYVTDLPSKPLPVFLNKKRQFSIINKTDMKFVPMNETCRKAGITAFSATGPVEMTSTPPTSLNQGETKTFELRYNEADPSPVTLRFLLERPGGIRNEYFLELTLSGPDLSNATTVFKRIAGDASSVVEVQGTREQHSTAGPIEFSAKPLTNGIRLRIRNTSPYKLWFRSPEATEPRDREKEYIDEAITIRHGTPSFSLYAHGAGELPFDVDFGLPHGIEISSGSVVQKKRIRINLDQSTGLNADSFTVNEGAEYDTYECTVRYKRKRDLEFVYLGDGVPDKDGAYIYIPVASPSTLQILKVDANALVPIAGTGLSGGLAGGGVFAAPNSVGVLKDKVIAILKNTDFVVYDHSLRFIKVIRLTQHDVVTNLKGASNDVKFCLLGMKQENSGPFKYSYSYVERSFDPAFNNERDLVLDLQKGFTPARVPGAPAWVSPSTTSPIDVSMGVAVALCVEGGLILVDLKRKAVMEVAINGTGREEAVVIDPIEPVIFCAHAKPDTHGLMITRINSSNLSDKQTITLPSTVTHMVTDTNAFVGPNLRYNRPRAVSLAVTPDTLFVSHAMKIYALDKKRLTERQQITVDLPCRLIQARRMKAPGEAHAKYGTPRDCYMLWAIGSMYIGGGQNMEKFRTALYKIAVVL